MRRVLLVLALVAACSDDTAAPEGSGDTPPETAPVPSHGPDTTGPAAAAEIMLSPIDEVLGIPSDPYEISQAYGEMYDREGDLVEECMASAGFEFTYHRAPAPDPAGIAQVFGMGSTQRMLEANGYGIVTNLRAALDSAAQAANAEPSPFNLDTPEGQAMWDQYLSCRARPNMSMPDPLPDIPLAVREEVNTFRASINRDPAVQAVWTDWSRCMASSGFDVRDRDAAIDEIDRTAGSLGLDANQLAMAGQDGAAPSPGVAAKIDEVAAAEQRLVESDIACAEQINLDTRLYDERLRLEQVFVDEHGQRLALAIAEARSP